MIRSARFLNPMAHNILFLSKKADLAGSARSLYYLLKFLDKKKFCPFVLFPGRGEMTERIRRLGAECRIMRFRPWRQVKYAAHQVYTIIRLFLFIKKHRIELVHSNTYEYNPLGLAAARLAGIPMLTHLRDEIDAKRAAKYMLPRADRVISVSRNVVPAGVKNFIVIRNGVDPDEIRERTGKKASHSLKKKWGLSPSCPVLGSIGIIGRNKNQLALVGLALILKERLKDFRFFVIGEAAEPSYYGLLKERVRESGLEKHFLFTGPVRNVYAYTACMDFVLVPSFREAASRVILESMALEKVVLASDIPGNREIIRHGKNGFLFPPDDPAKAAAVILRLVKNRAAVKRIGRTALETIRKDYQARENTRRVEELYGKFLRIPAIRSPRALSASSGPRH